MHASPIISLENVSKAYSNGTIALQNLNLEIAPATLVSLVGPSGCGKSTVLRLIAGLGNMTTGTITWNRHHAQHKLAYVFQEAALLPWATVLDNVRLPLKLAKMPQRQTLLAASEAIASVLSCLAVANVAVYAAAAWITLLLGRVTY
ncbi:ATP-binding cassette domain-containing protein [Chroococcidiopsis sp. TS-821]|uniref:ATP-binding cassette domain-containing protein n=1 Tax=Chroococcidiopsis sp. TS-821 TaxID=1378066 RepID=UPI000CEEE01E|nr:ATP-binding cassette domain-containing protein [Chroococcidiopsis sp. TS-821]PPS43561.1 hypothetical protein B1A85_12855 [Chroococcidiopsis sp. TS-821]